MWLYFCQRVPVFLTALPVHLGSPVVRKSELESNSHVSGAWEGGHSSWGQAAQAAKGLATRMGWLLLGMLPAQGAC